MTDSASPTKPKKTSSTGWKSWIVYIVIAFILAFWSIVAALFFLGVVWIMRQNPDPDSGLGVGSTEKSTARRVYTWLFFSPFLAVPLFLFIIISSYSGSSSNNEKVLTALVPLLLHAPLLLGFTSKSVFVYRHTQQGILLIALRAGMAATALSIGDYPEDGLGLFLVGNGLLWLFGSIWGWTQINHGECWWMKRKGEVVEIALKNQVENLAPQKHIEQSRDFIRRYNADEAKKHALAAFRSGDREVKRQAIQILETLDDVELF